MNNKIQWRTQEFPGGGLKFFKCRGGGSANPLDTKDLPDPRGGSIIIAPPCITFDKIVNKDPNFPGHPPYFYSL